MVLYIDSPNECIKIGLVRDSNLFKYIFKGIRNFKLNESYSLEYICDKCLNYNSDSDIDIYFNEDDVINSCECNKHKFLSLITTEWNSNFYNIFDNYDLGDKDSLNKLLKIIKYIYEYLYVIENFEKLINL